jgi:hypothetical protein
MTKLQSLQRIAVTFVLFTAVAFNLACPKPSVNSLVRTAERVGTTAQRVAPVFQSLIDSGVIKPGFVIKRLNQVAVDAPLLADALRTSSSDAIEITARLTTFVRQLVDQDAQLIPAGPKRTLVLAILAAAEIALDEISDSFGKAAAANPITARAVKAGHATAAETIAAFKNRCALHARSSVTGRYVTITYAEAHPEETYVARECRR